MVLAGGASTRMGRDKATLPWKGGTFLSEIVDALRAACAEVFVVAAPDQRLPVIPATVVRDSVAHQGPLHGLITGLEAAQRAGHHWVFVCATDMPLVDARLVEILTRESGSEDVVLAHDGTRMQPLAALYSVAALDKARAYMKTGRRSMYGLINALESRVVEMSDHLGELININTPEEFEKLQSAEEKPVPGNDGQSNTRGNEESAVGATPFHSLDDYARLPRVSGLAISSDGQRLVTCVEQLNDDATRFVGHLWEVDPSGSHGARQVTFGPKGDSAPAFTADGDLLFVSARGTEDDAPASLWCLPARGGEAYELAKPPGGVAAVRAARAVDRVVVTASTFPHVASDDADRKVRERRKTAKVNAIIHTGYPVRYWDHDLGPEVPGLQTGSSAGEFTRLLAGAELREARMDLSTDGSFLVSTWQVPGPLARLRTQLVRIDTTTGARDVLADETDADFGLPSIAPDGTRVAYVREAHGDPDTPPQVTLHVKDMAAGEETQLARDFDRWATSISWLPDSSALIITADHYSRAPIFVVPLDGSEVRQLTHDDAAYSDVVVAPSGGVVYALRAAINRPPHPVRIDVSSGEITDLQGPARAPEIPGSVTEVMTQSEDGTPLRAWLAEPLDASPENPAPLLVWIHGGPLNSWNTWQWRWNPWLMVARGYSVLLPDPALSTGFGREFIQRGWGRWGKEPYTDIMALTDAAELRPEIDASRTAAMGGSFGGYMANWIAGHTDRFNAIVTHASLWALDQFGPTTDAAWFWAREMTPEMAVENSPHLYVADIRTPMLVIHGDKDYRVPIGEALRLWYELNSESALPADDQGISDHQFLYFPTENHWILSPQHAKIWYHTVYAFLAKNVLGKAEPWPEELGAGEFPPRVADET